MATAHMDLCGLAFLDSIKFPLKNIGPVSYTHLDVYKRQASQRPLIGIRFNFPGENQSMAQRRSSVSYTHLDVYKRQGERSLISTISPP